MSKFKLPHIAIVVNDIKKTKVFYSDIGFNIEEDIYSEEKKRQYLLLFGFGLEMEIFQFDEQTPNQSHFVDLMTVGLQHFALPVENVEIKKEELVSKGIEIIKDISISSLGVKGLNIKDPSGFIIEFFEKK